MPFGEGAGSGGGGSFGTMALQNANDVDITGGTITGLTELSSREICFTNGTNAHTVCLTSCVPAADVDFVFPCALGAAGSVLTDVAGDGVLTFQPVGNASITLSAGNNIQLAENSSVLLDAALSADGKYSADAAIAGTLGETVSFGHVVYFGSDSKWHKARANGVATSGSLALGIVLVAGGNGDPSTIMLRGNVRADAVFPTFTVGNAIYLSVATAGLVVDSQPASATDEVTRVLGQALTADSMFFNPSNDHTTHT